MQSHWQLTRQQGGKTLKIRNFLFLFTVHISAALCGGAADKIAEVKELLSIPSVATDVVSNDRAIEWMKGHLERHGVWCVVETWPGDGRKILYAATRKGLETPDYVLVTHLDVVAPVSVEQFVPVEKNGRLYARGACDTKVNAFCGAEALIRLNGLASVGCVFSSDEEIGGNTTKHMIALGHARPQRAVLVLDAGGMNSNITYSCKGNAYYKVTAIGKSGHSSCPEKCLNPNYLLAEAMLKIRDAYPHQKPGEWGNVASVTIIGGGDSQNRIPETATMTVNVRFTEDGGLERERMLIERITGLKTELIRGTPAAACDQNLPELKRIQTCVRLHYPSRAAELVRGTAANDMRYFPQFGKPFCALSMNHDGGHSSSEWCEVADIPNFINLLVSICRSE